MPRKYLIRRHPRWSPVDRPWMLITETGMSTHPTHAQAVLAATRLMRAEIAAEARRRAGKLLAYWRRGFREALTVVRKTWAQLKQAVRDSLHAAETLLKSRRSPAPKPDFVDVLRATARRDYRPPNMRPVSLDSARIRTWQHPVYRASGRR